MEPLRGLDDGSCRARGLPRIRLVGRLTRREPSSLSVLKGGDLDAPRHSLGALGKVV